MVELVSLMSATYIYFLCQALDLRCLQIEFVRAAEPAMYKPLHEHFRSLVLQDWVDMSTKQTWRFYKKNC